MREVLVALALMLVLAGVAWLLRRRRVALLTAARAQRLPPCTCTLRRTLSWVRFASADAYLLDGVLVVLTFNGALRIFRDGARTEPMPGWPFRFADVVAREVTRENDEVKVTYAGFAGGTLTMRGLPHEAQQQVLRALKA